MSSLPCHLEKLVFITYSSVLTNFSVPRWRRSRDTDFPLFGGCLHDSPCPRMQCIQLHQCWKACLDWAVNFHDSMWKAIAQTKIFVFMQHKGSWWSKLVFHISNQVSESPSPDTNLYATKPAISKTWQSFRSNLGDIPFLILQGKRWRTTSEQYYSPARSCTCLKGDLWTAIQ